MTKTGRARPHAAEATHRWQAFLSFVLTLLIAGSCLAEGGKEKVGRDASEGARRAASSSRPYVYALVDGGFKIVNGPGLYNRPLYGPHCRDLDSFDERVLAVVGDSPDALVLLTNWRVPGGGGCSAAKLGHFFLGLRSAQDGKWFHDFKTVKACYVSGRQDYELQDPSVHGTIRLSYVRPVEFEGLLVRVRLPGGLNAGNLVFACGGATDWTGGHLDYQGGKGSAKDFHPQQCQGNDVRLLEQGFAVRRPFKGHNRTLYGAASASLQLSIGDAAAMLKRPANLLASKLESQPMVVGTCAPTDATEICFVLTPDALNLPAIQAYLASPGPVFEACCKHYGDLSQTVKIDTPDPYLNLGFAAQILGQDGAWHDPCFTHGPWSWSSPYAGWRICYGPTVLGWHQRVQSSTAEFFKDQAKQPEYPSPVWRGPGGYPQGHVCRGAVPDLARNRSYFYNMGEVLVDHILYDWEWTGDLPFMTKAFEFITDKLLWEERCLDPDGDGLYENWLNTWVSDAHWYNGSGCIQASVYNWRANRMMAEIAKRLGKDPKVFQARAEKIKRACDQLLWISHEGVYAEYKDALGHKRLHTAPEQASIYHPIDFRFCDEFQSYQMLRYTEYAIKNEVGTVPRGGRLVWSSNWLPELYSSHGLYPQETINLMLCYYRLGLTEKADALLKGITASFFMGPCPGGIAHRQRPDGTHSGSTDFTDTTSMFIRTVVEGLFGVQMNVPGERVTVQPCFPRDWGRASIRAADISYEYTWDGKAERLHIMTPKRLVYQVRLMARTAQVDSVRLNGGQARFRWEPGMRRAWVVVETPKSDEAQIEVSYGAGALSAIDFSPVAGVGQPYSFTVRDGKILEVRDPQGLLRDVRTNGSRCDARLHGEPGWHTFFAHAQSGQAHVWLPVDVELRPALEIFDGRLVVEGGRMRCLCALRNNTQRAAHVSGQMGLAGSVQAIEANLPPFGGIGEIAMDIGDPGQLTPGTNRLTAKIHGDYSGVLEGIAVDWQLAAKIASVAGSAAKARTIPLTGLLNLELARLHDQSYRAPRPKTYSIMVQENGRSIWDWNAQGYCVVKPHTDRLQNAGGKLVSDAKVPFAVPQAGANACFTSLWKNFPPRVTVPVGARGRKVYFLIAAATNPMQSQMENARITVSLAGGEKRVLPLVNPQNLDDWLCVPYAQTGLVQSLGEKTHALILDMDLGEEADVRDIELECLSNEVLVGLLGVTLM